MTTSPEVLPTSAASPSNAPSDTLLKSFRTTLKQRWQEFDSATMEEARKSPMAQFGSFLGIASDTDIRSKRDADLDFQKAKSTFDEAISTLQNIGTDAQLRTIIENPGRLSSVIITLQKYLDNADKEKAHNTVLSATLADLTQLKAQVTNNPEDTRAAEVARSAVPATVAAATAAGSVLAIPEVRGAIDEVKSEVTGEIKKAIGPWGMIFQGVKDIPAKEVAAQIKELSKDWSEKKWLDDPFDKLFAGIKLFFLRFQIRRAGLDLSKDMTPEEMRLAGITPIGAASPGEKAREIIKTQDPLLYQKYVEYLSIFGTDKGKVRNDVRKVLQGENFAKLSLKEFQDFRNNPSEFAKKFSLSEELSSNILKIFFGNKTIEKYMSRPPTSPTETIGERITSLPEEMIHAGKIMMQLDGISGVKDIGSAVKSGFSEIFSVKEGKLHAPEIEKKIQSLGISSSSALFFLTTDLQTSVKTPESSDEVKSLIKDKLDPFWGKTLAPLVEKFIPVNLRSSVQGTLSSSANWKDVFELYILMDGSSDINKISSFQKTLLFMKLWEMMSENPALRGQTLDRNFLEGIFGMKSSIDPEVYEIIGRSMDSIVKKTFTTFFGAMNETWNAIPDVEKYTILGVFGVLMVIGWRFRMIFSIIQWSAILALLSVIAPKAYAIMKDDKKLEEAFNKDIAGNK